MRTAASCIFLKLLVFQNTFIRTPSNFDAGQALSPPWTEIMEDSLIHCGLKMHQQFFSVDLVKPGKLWIMQSKTNSGKN